MYKILPLIKKVFESDLRSLAILRIGCALVITMDLIQRSFNLYTHYSDLGVFPRQALIIQDTSIWRLSIHLINGTWQIQALLFLLAGLFALALLIGYKTKLASMLSWFFFISLLNRNPFLISGGDQLLSLVLFIGIFLPWGTKYSLDSFSFDNVKIPKKIFTLATLAYAYQIIIMYWFAAMLKNGDTWRYEGSAVYYALNIYTYQTDIGIKFGQFLIQYPYLLKSLTFGILSFEIIGPFLLVLSAFKENLRIIILFLFITMHLAFGLFLGIWLFSLTVIVCLLGLLPSGFIDKLESAFQKYGVITRLKTVFKHLFALKALDKNLFNQKRTPENINLSWFSKTVIVFFLAFTFFWNIGTVSEFKAIATGDFLKEVRGIGLLLRIDQNWGLFSPDPSKTDGWYIIPAKLKNGKVVDLLNKGNPVIWEKPINQYSFQKEIRWRRYLSFVIQDKRQNLYPHLALYLCRSWNESHLEEVMAFEVFYIEQETLPRGGHSAPKKTGIFRYNCGNKKITNF